MRENYASFRDNYNGGKKKKEYFYKNRPRRDTAHTVQ